MSSGSTYDVSKFNMTGGFPSSTDLAPSIVFTILYAIALPVLIWRWCRKDSRTTVLIRPTIFLFARLGAFILRAIMAKSNYGINELIAELVLISVGTLFLIEPLISLWKKNIESAVQVHERPSWVQRLATILKITLLAAIATAIAGASNISSAINDPSKIGQVKHLRETSSILTVVVVVVAIFANVSTTMSFRLDTRRSGYLLIPSVFLLIDSVYRVIQVYSTDPTSDVNKKAVFWVLDAATTLLAFVCYIAVPLNVWYPGAPKDEEGDLEAARKTSQQSEAPLQTRQVPRNRY